MIDTSVDEKKQNKKIHSVVKPQEDYKALYQLIFNTKIFTWQLGLIQECHLEDDYMKYIL